MERDVSDKQQGSCRVSVPPRRGVRPRWTWGRNGPIVAGARGADMPTAARVTRRWSAGHMARFALSPKDMKTKPIQGPEAQRALLRNLSRELFQTEVSAARHCRREARRNPG